MMCFELEFLIFCSFVLSLHFYHIFHFMLDVEIKETKYNHICASIEIISFSFGVFCISFFLFSSFCMHFSIQWFWPSSFVFFYFFWSFSFAWSYFLSFSFSVFSTFDSKQEYFGQRNSHTEGQYCLDKWWCWSPSVSCTPYSKLLDRLHSSVRNI